MKALLALLLSLTLASGDSKPAPVQIDSLEVGGRTYTKCTVKRLDAVFASIAHSTGSKRVEMSRLPAEIQSALGYDANADQAARDDQQNRAAVAAFIFKNAKPLKGEVVQVLQDGILVSPLRIYKEREATLREKTYKTIRVGNSLRGYKTVRVPETTEKKALVSDEVDSWFRDDWVFLRCNPEGLVDGDLILEDIVFAKGTMSYTTSLGSTKTVKCFTLDLADVFQLKE